MLSSVVLGFSVLFKDPGKRQNRLFSWFTASYAAWCFFYLMWQLAETADAALIYSRLLLGCSTFIPITYYHFVCRLVGSSNSREIRVGYFVSVAIAAFTPTPFLVRAVEPAMMFPFWPKGGPVFIPYIILFAYFTVRAWMVLFEAYRHSTHSRRNQLGYVMSGTVLGWIGGLTNFLLWFDIPVPPVGNGLALVYIVGVGYAMVRFRLVEMHRLVVRMVGYGAVVVILSPVIPLALSAVSRISGQDPLPDMMMFGSAIAITGFLFLAAQFLKHQVDRVLEGTILREDFQGRNQLRVLAQRISTIANEEEMYEEVILGVSDALDTAGAAIVVRGELESAYTPKSQIGFDDNFAEQFCFEPDDRFVTVLERSRQAVLTEELESDGDGAIAARAQQLRVQFDIAAAVPIHVETTFFGLLLLRPRGRHRLFSNTDLSLLDTVCLQIGLGLRSRQLERRANQTEKLLSLGTLAAGLAHELRNPLTSIQTYAGLLKENSADAEFQREFGDIMQRDIARIVGIVENISSFATRDTVKFTHLQIGEVIQAAYEITQAAFHHGGVAFEFQNRTMPMISGNYNQLLQVFINIFQNGVEALGTREDGCIKVQLRDVNPEVITPSIEISISDNGPGIEPDVLARIFDPFITTKSTGLRKGSGGMGLGLAIVRRVIDSHHGVIRAVSSADSGTEFLISVPVAEGSA